MARKRKSLIINKDKLKKNSTTEPTVDATQGLGIVRPINPVVTYPSLSSASGNGWSYDFTKHYGKGFDDIVNRAYYTAKALLKNTDDLTEKTQRGYLSAGFVYFSAFLEIFHQSTGEDLTQADITPELIGHFLFHLKGSELGYSSQKDAYTKIKSLLVQMRNKGYWTIDNSVNLKEDFFPKNPFPNSKKRGAGKAAKPLTQHEKRQIVVSLKQALKMIYSKTDPLSGYELTLCLLFVAVNTGINTTPLLQMTTDALSPHPLKDNRKLLTVFKKRGNGTQIHNLRKSELIDVSQGVKLDVAYIIERIIELNAPVRQSIGGDLVFVYKAKDIKDSSLSDSLLKSNIKKFIEEYDLKDDDGKQLKLNISRLRKTFINGIFELSGEITLVTAQQAKHSGTGTLDHYLQPPEEKKRSLGLMGEIRVVELTDDTPKVPVGRCKDPINGDKAPKNGTFCNDFLGCFRCKSFVITGDDLWKLFSFYWAIVRNRDDFGRKDWKRHLKNVLKIVDEEVVPAFAKQGQLQRVEEEKERAKVTPHPYWKNLDMLKVIK